MVVEAAAPRGGNRKPEAQVVSYAPGTMCWIPCSVNVWKPADVVDTRNNRIIMKVVGPSHTENVGEEIEIGPDVPVYLRNEELMSAQGLISLDDLTQLNHLHEAEVLNSLNVRFDVDKIYTFTGQILIALNPFKRIAGMYEAETLKMFLKCGSQMYTDGTRIPHVFSTANQAYAGLCTKKTSQTILISGESGAGKTESTKFVMKLLAMAGSKDWENRSLIENQVLQSNPLLEAFGNAKTLRNDNSSRFGKFIEMQFQLEPVKGQESLIGRLAGARIQTYLLESVRVCRQLEGERNYHAFYQLCCAAHKASETGGKFTLNVEQAASMGITLHNSIEYDLSSFSSHDNYRFLTKSSCSTLANVDDLDEFRATALAMHTVGIPVEEQRIIWNMAGAVLFLGNVVFDAPSGQSESSMIAPMCKPQFETLGRLLGVSTKVLEKVLCFRTIRTRDENISKPLTVSGAEDCRDALARALYNTLFLRIVQRTNVSIGHRADVELFCGVLDIFGFECFDTNSFEQLCINFTNERLQQFFNEFVFKCEEQLYKEENIPWDPLDFPDNQDCVELLQAKPFGLFSMLDEECFVPQGNDKGYCAKLIQQHKGNRRFNELKTKPNWFVVIHFAGPVNYCTDGFVDKNKDQLSVDCQEAIRGSACTFIAGCFTEFLVRGVEAPGAAGAPARPGPKGKRQITVSSEFKDQLTDLMKTVSSTAPHFIRCIKPNPQNRPDLFNRLTVTEQLRNAGVLQAVQVSRAGYPVRSPHKACFSEYKCLLSLNELEECQRIPEEKDKVLRMLTILDEKLKIPKPKHLTINSWAVGKSVVFMKHEAFEILSAARVAKRQATVRRLQEMYRAKMLRKWYLSTLENIRAVQRILRCYRDVMETVKKQEIWLASVTQKYMHAYLARTHFERVRASSLLLQHVIRSVRPIKETTRLRYEGAATTIQAYIRMGQAVVRQAKYKSQVILIQCRARQGVAMEQTKQLRAAAKDSKKLQAEKERLQAQLQAAEEQRRLELEAEKARRDEEMKKLQEENETRMAEELRKLQANLSMVETEETEILKTRIQELEATVASLEAKAATLEEKATSLEDKAAILETENRELKSKGTPDSVTSTRPSTTAGSPTSMGDFEPLIQNRALESTVDTPENIGHVSSMRFPIQLDAGEGVSASETAALEARYKELEDKLAEVKQTLHCYECGFGRMPADQHHAIKMLTANTEKKGNMKEEVPKNAEVIVNVLLLGSTVPLLETLGDILKQNTFSSLNQREIDRIDLYRRNCEQGIVEIGKTVPVFMVSHEVDEEIQDRARASQQSLTSQGRSPSSTKRVVTNRTPSNEHSNAGLSPAGRTNSLGVKHVTLSIGIWDTDLLLPTLMNKSSTLSSFPPPVVTELQWLRKASEYAMHAVFVPSPTDETEHLTEEITGAYRVLSQLSTYAHPFIVLKDSVSSEEMPLLVRFRHVEFLSRQLLPRVFEGLFADKALRCLVELPQKISSVTSQAAPKSSYPSGGTSKLTNLIRNLVLDNSSSSTATNHSQPTTLEKSSSKAQLPGTYRSRNQAQMMTSFLNPSIRKPAAGSDAATKLCWKEVAQKDNHGAITCVQFGSDLYRKFVFLGVGYKTGSIFVHKMGRTQEELRLFDEAHAQRPSEDDDGTQCTSEEEESWFNAKEIGFMGSKQLDGHQRAVTSLVFANKDKQLVSTSIDCTVKFWDTKQGHLLKVFTDAVPILLAAFLPHTDDLFLTSNTSSIIRLVNATNGKITQKFKADSEIRAVCFDESGFQCFAGTRDGCIQIFEVSPEHLSFVRKHQVSKNAAITSMTFYNSRQSGPPFIAVNSCDHKISIYDCVYKNLTGTASSLRMRQRLDIKHQILPLSSRVFCSSGNVFLVSASEDAQVDVFCATQETGDFLHAEVLQCGKKSPVISVDVNRQASVMVAADTAGVIHVFRRVWI